MPAVPGPRPDQIRQDGASVGDVLTVGAFSPEFATPPAQTNETFVPTLGQTVFNLAATPSSHADVQMFINTVKYIIITNYTVAGSVVTWTDFPFTLDSLDIVEFIYFI